MANESIFQHDGKPKIETATDAVLSGAVERGYNMTSYELELRRVLSEAISVLMLKHHQYGPSWKKRGGVGAFMMLARKWDRIEKQVEDFNWDVFHACQSDRHTTDNLLDDIRDLRNYLTLVEHEVKTLYGDFQGRGRDAAECNAADN